MTRQAQRMGPILGVASIGLGVPQTLVPDRFARAIGVSPSSTTRALTVAVGVRELAAAAGLLALERSRPVRSTWARVAGDAMDIGLLVAALRRGSDAPERTRAALGAVVAIAGVDLMTAVRLAQTSDGKEEQRMQVEAVITTVKSQDEVRQAWETSEEIAELQGLGSVDVRFTPAPGDRGTEIHVTLRPADGRGPVRAVVAKVKGTSPRQQTHDHLRRFKQILETGEVARSDGTPEGHTARMQPKQRPAQPVESAKS